jgi:hypothetical protein
MSRGNGTIAYHGNRRYTRILPLQSYSNPPSEKKFDGLDYFDFQLDKVSHVTWRCSMLCIDAAIIVCRAIRRDDLPLSRLQSSSTSSPTSPRHCRKLKRVRPFRVNSPMRFSTKPWCKKETKTSCTIFSCMNAIQRLSLTITIYQMVCAII